MSKKYCIMSASIFDKILKIIQIVVTLLQMAVKAFTNFVEEQDEAEVSD